MLLSLYNIFHLIIEPSNVFADISDLDANCGYVKQPGLYALCLLLDTECHVIPAASTVIRPFIEENGVAITFDEETFGSDETKVEFKVTFDFYIPCS